MNLEQLKAFIIEEKENGYLLDVWKPMFSVWKVELHRDEPTSVIFESFLSKMMEFHRACIEEGDHLPEVWINKSFRECHIHLVKHNGEQWKYILSPTGFQGQWEIFHVIKRKADK